MADSTTALSLDSNQSHVTPDEQTSVVGLPPSPIQTDEQFRAQNDQNEHIEHNSEIQNTQESQNTSQDVTGEVYHDGMNVSQDQSQEMSQDPSQSMSQGSKQSVPIHFKKRKFDEKKDPNLINNSKVIVRTKSGSGKEVITHSVFLRLYID